MKLRLPQPLEPLACLAYDLWWTWDEEARALFQDADPAGWIESYHNPVSMLANLSYVRAMELSEDAPFLDRLNRVVQRWRALHDRLEPQVPVSGADARHPVAYFCMEYGIHECLPIYSGGLGILAGDHLKSASDLGIPLVAVGLLYREGYFSQRIENGEQVEVYERHDPNLLPIVPVLDDEGNRVRVRIPDNHGGYEVQAWEVMVGRVKLYLLDANVPGASWWHQQYTRRLYGGTSDTRVAQEVLLGVGGVRLLRKLGYDPAVFHMNEGHAAFLSLELVREGLEAGHDLDESISAAKQRTVFTTHTPVLAGHDRFTWDQIQDHLAGFRERLDLPEGFIMDLGRIWPGDVGAPTCMTILALRMSRAANGVSSLHGEVSREMWKELYEPEEHSPIAGVAAAPPPSPIGHITNGVHVPTWISPPMAELLQQHVPGWAEAWREPEAWARAVEEIPDEALWEVRRANRLALVDWLVSFGHPRLDPDALTIGFARRFAPYKRGNLIFRDPDRLARIMSEVPLQILFSGKAHPADLRGHAILSEVVEWTRDPRFRNRVLFIPDYDMQTGRYLVQGCDIWLNNPRRPNEASGTSGQKAALQGGLNLSVLDGWWPEAYDGENGWAIEARSRSNVSQVQDQADAEALYATLEQQVIPPWKDREGGVPRQWIRRLKRSMAVCLPRFDSRRMLAEYVRMYDAGS